MVATMLAAILSLSGSVLAADASTALVHHDPFGGMPAMTMTFRIPAGTRLVPGDAITAAVDRSTEPWSLSHLHVRHATRPSAATLPAFVHVDERVPDLALVDQRDRAFSLESLRGTPYVLAFVYTRCADPSMCPLVSAKFERLQHRTANERVTLLEISLDPAWDRPPVLARYAAQFGADPARWRIATGEPQRVLDFAARFGILERSAGPVTIVHTERLAVVRADGTIAKLIDGAAWNPADVARALRALTSER